VSLRRVKRIDQPEIWDDNEGEDMKLTGERNQCQGCKQYFTRTSVFDKHRIGEHGKNRRCLTPAEMIAKGMFVGADGVWRGETMDECYFTQAGERDRVALDARNAYNKN
jgi:hypothetical protein